MTTPGRDIAAESAASVASLQGFTKHFQADQAKYLATTSAPMVAMAALRMQDRMRAVNEEFAARDADQLFQIRKQQWITNKLLAGWTVEDINEEIAAGEALAAEEIPDKGSDVSLGSALFLMLFAVGAVIALVYGFTHVG